MDWKLFLTLLLSVNKILVLTMNRQDFLAVGVRLNACMAGNASAFLYFTSVEWQLAMAGITEGIGETHNVVYTLEVVGKG